MIAFACASVCELLYVYVYQCMVMCFSVCVRNLIVNIWGPQKMRAYIFLGLIFLEIRKKEWFWIPFLESITSTKNNHKPAKGSLSSSQLFVTSLHTCFCKCHLHISFSFLLILADLDWQHLPNEVPISTCCKILPQFWKIIKDFHFQI